MSEISIIKHIFFHKENVNNLILSMNQVGSHYLFSRSQSPNVPLMSWLGVHFRVRLSPAWWSDRYPRNTSMSFFYHGRKRKDTRWDWEIWGCIRPYFILKLASEKFKVATEWHNNYISEISVLNIRWEDLYHYLSESWEATGLA